MALKLLLFIQACALFTVGEILAVKESAKNENSQNLILIILGGFRWDYITMHLNSSDPGFKYILQHGGRAKYIEPVFPGTTLPNLQTIVTGKYPEQHGIVDNYMFDRSTSRTFSVDDPDAARQPEWWDAADPLWVTAKNHNLSYVYTADAARCNLPWADLAPTYCGPLQEQISMALECIENNSCDTFMMNTGAVETAGLHHGPKSSDVRAPVREVDSALTLLWKGLKSKGLAHKMNTGAVETAGLHHGPKSSDVRAAVKEVDSALTLLWKGLKSKGLAHKTNVVLVSDHGITSTGPSEVEELSLDPCVDWSLMVATVGCGGYIVLQPIQGIQIKVWNSLRYCYHIKGKTKLFMTRLMYPEYHYSHNHRILKIIVIAKNGMFLQCPSNNSAALDPTWAGDARQQGMAGYDDTFGDNPDMRGVLLVNGPGFRPGPLNGSVHQVDVHSLLCAALELPCTAAGDGDLTRIAPLLTKPLVQPELPHVDAVAAAAAAPLLGQLNIFMVVLGMGMLFSYYRL